MSVLHGDINQVHDGNKYWRDRCWSESYPSLGRDVLKVCCLCGAAVPEEWAERHVTFHRRVGS